MDLFVGRHYHMGALRVKANTNQLLSMWASLFSNGVATATFLEIGSRNFRAKALQLAKAIPPKCMVLNKRLVENTKELQA